MLETPTDVTVPVPGVNPSAVVTSLLVRVTAPVLVLKLVTPPPGLAHVPSALKKFDVPPPLPATTPGVVDVKMLGVSVMVPLLVTGEVLTLQVSSLDLHLLFLLKVLTILLLPLLISLI